MAKVSLIGLGAMGAALAEALILAGHGVTVWNRSPGKAAALVAKGAALAPDLTALLRAAPVTLVCLDSCATTRALFEVGELRPLLDGHGVIDLSTTTPGESRDAAAWFADRGASYLDGAILCGVRAIGTPSGLLLYAGDEALFQQSRPILAALGRPPEFVGVEPGGAAILDLIWLTRIAADYLAVYQGAALARAEGVALERIATAFPGDKGLELMLAPLLTGDFVPPPASVAVWNKAARKIAAQAREAGISRALPDLIVDILTRTETAGHGNLRMAAMVRVLGRKGDF